MSSASAIKAHHDRFLTIAEVTAITTLKSSTIYEWIAKRGFPRQIQLSPGCSRWSEREIVEWMERARNAPPVQTKRRGRPAKALPLSAANKS